ncbi:MAG: transposase family protein [Prevotellaceae bacterium]|nr:transposase family protein [Prevotellaceae bacterium]MDY6131130.1 transposase family protein [Prevotella sp.]
MKVQRLECKKCGCVRQESIHFVTGKRAYTNKFARYVVSLSRIGTIKDVASFLHVLWDTIKEIQKIYLQLHYGHPNLKRLRYVGINGFAVA